MQYKFLCALIAGTLFLAGCATLKQAKDDAKTGLTAPLAEGEASPQDQATQIADAVKALPVPGAQTAGTALYWLALPVLGWMRGRAIRKNQPLAANPITGYLGDKTNLEGVVQAVSTVSQGVTEFFKEGSSAQHAWQGILTGLGGLAGASFAIPAVKTLVVAHPEIALWVGGGAGVLNAVQQGLSKVLPVATPQPATVGA